MSGIPVDILKRLGRKRKDMATLNIASADLNVIWAALIDASELIESCIESDERPNKSTHDAKYRNYMAGLNGSLKHYRRVLKHVIREGNERNWR
jgi:hypothetical protein